MKAQEIGEQSYANFRDDWLVSDPPAKKFPVKMWGKMKRKKSAVEWKPCHVWPCHVWSWPRDMTYKWRISSVITLVFVHTRLTTHKHTLFPPIAKPVLRNLFQLVAKVGSVNSPPRLIMKYIKEIRTLCKYGNKQSFVACAVIHCKVFQTG